jgi:hypothetical protein
VVLLLVLRPIPVADPKKLAPPTTAAVSRPNFMHSSVSGGSTSTASNSTSKKAVRKIVLTKTSTSSLSTEAPVKEWEAKEDTGSIIEEERCGCG